MTPLQYSAADLRRAANLKERIETLEKRLGKIFSQKPESPGPEAPAKKLHWSQTLAGRRKIARIQRRAWKQRRETVSHVA